MAVPTGTAKTISSYPTPLTSTTEGSPMLIRFWGRFRTMTALLFTPSLTDPSSPMPLAITLEDDTVDGGVAAGGTELPLGQDRRLLNPGSVGQPRDGDPRAAWLLLDYERETATFRRVEYDVASTQQEIRERELPDALAQRLAHGV